MKNSDINKFKLRKEYIDKEFEKRTKNLPLSTIKKSLIKKRIRCEAKKLYP
jgi:hypothetical protein